MPGWGREPVPDVVGAADAAAAVAAAAEVALARAGAALQAEHWEAAEASMGRASSHLEDLLDCQDPEVVKLRRRSREVLCTPA